MDKSLRPLQYTLPVIQQPDFTSYSYFVNSGNQDAYGLIETWPSWSFRYWVVWGPPGYGKTHLGHILRDRTEGVFLNAAQVSSCLLSKIQPNTSYILDDIQYIQDPRLLFHFYNLTLANNCSVVYLSNKAPGQVDMGLADLNSRLRSLPAIELSPPDDNLCRAVIKKVFSDLQVNIADESVDYILVHTSRSLTDIQVNLQTLNQRSLEEKRSITIPFIKAVLNVF